MKRQVQRPKARPASRPPAPTKVAPPPAPKPAPVAAKPTPAPAAPAGNSAVPKVKSKVKSDEHPIRILREIGQFLNDKNYLTDTIRATVVREVLYVFREHLASQLSVNADKMIKDVKVIADKILDVSAHNAFTADKIRDVSAHKAFTTIFDELDAINGSIQRKKSKWQSSEKYYSKMQEQFQKNK